MARAVLGGPAGAALAGLLHATAGGAVVVAGFGLAVPGLIEAANPLEAVAQAAAFGLASLGVSLESGDVEGSFAPLSGLVLTLWGISSTVRRTAAKSRAPAVRHAAATGLCLGIACAVTAAAAGSITSIEPSPPDAALAGLLWGSIGAALGRVAPIRTKLAGLVPGLVTVGVALGLAFVWFFVAVVIGVAGGSSRQIIGGVLLALMAAPNAAAALVAVGVGGAVDVVFDAGLLERPLRDSLSLWKGAGPYVLALAAVPALAAFVGGRVAAALTPAFSSLVRGLRNGAALTIVLVIAAALGSLGATSAADGERLSVRLSFFPGILGFAIALAWGGAGAYAGDRFPLHGRRPRVDDP